MSPLWQLARPRAASLARLLPFVGAWVFLDCLFNLRFPGDEPTLWYPLPSIDVAVVLAVFLVVRLRGYQIPQGVRIALVALALAARIFRSAEGLVEKHFHRPLSLYLDVPLVPSLIGLLRSTVPLPHLVIGTLLAGVAIVLLGALTARALTVAERALSSTGPRRLFVAVLVICAALSPLWRQRRDPHLHVGLFGASIVPRLARELAVLRHAPEYRRRKAAAIAAVRERLDQTPAALDRLHRANVLLFLVESYGETVFEQPAYARRMAPVYDTFEAAMAKSGFTLASSLLASPTYGGRSWLAHATLATGVRTEDGLAYTVLLESQPPPPTMAGFFQRAGYRTVLVQPGTTRRWPEGEVSGFAQKYYAMDLGYRGPAFKWATMPDQYVVDFVHRREVQRSLGGANDPARPPLFVEYALVSSHSPWSLQPRLVEDWERLRDGGAIFNDLPPIRYAVTWSNLQVGGDAYVTSLIYDLDVLRRYLVERIDDDTLVIILGDHQPSAEVTGDTPSYGVPIHVISRDRAFIQRFTAAGYVPGMRVPLPHPQLAMEAFLEQLLAMFSTPGVAAARHR